jgi:hypothetical protein
MLHTIWMAYKRPELRDLFLQVVEPTTDNLRTMGMVQMQLADERPPLISAVKNIEYDSSRGRYSMEIG